MNYKAPDNSLHFLSAEDVANGGEAYLPSGSIPITEDEAGAIRSENHPERSASEIRADRNARLSTCDWTQMPDAPLTNEQKSAWKAYRQSLRDVTEQEGFPADVTWPQEPAALSAGVRDA